MQLQPPFFLTDEDNQYLATYGETQPFYIMDMEDDNKKDAFLSLANDEMEAIVSEDHGGIIGYAFKGIAEEVVTVLNVNYRLNEEDPV